VIAPLSKTRTVLKFDVRTTTVSGSSMKATVMFDQTETEGGNAVPYLALDQDVWEDMGRPNEITVTVRPGDRLNP
jgi:hypothetical protein